MRELEACVCNKLKL